MMMVSTPPNVVDAISLGHRDDNSADSVAWWHNRQPAEHDWRRRVCPYSTPPDSPTDRGMIAGVSAVVSPQPETVGSEPATGSPRGLRVVVYTATAHCKQILMIGLFFHKSANFSYYYIFGLTIYLISQIIGLLLQRITNIHSAIYED